MGDKVCRNIFLTCDTWRWVVTMRRRYIVRPVCISALCACEEGYVLVGCGGGDNWNVVFGWTALSEPSINSVRQDANVHFPTVRFFPLSKSFLFKRSFSLIPTCFAISLYSLYLRRKPSVDDCLYVHSSLHVDGLWKTCCLLSLTGSLVVLRPRLCRTS